MPSKSANLRVPYKRRFSILFEKSTNVVNTLSLNGLDNYRKKRGDFFINLAEEFIEDLEALKFLEAFRFFVKEANEEEYYKLKKLLNN